MSTIDRHLRTYLARVLYLRRRELLRVLKKGSDPQEEKSDLHEEKKNPQEEKNEPAGREKWTVCLDGEVRLDLLVQLSLVVTPFVGMNQFKYIRF